MSGYATMFAEKGFTTLESDIDIPAHCVSDSQALMGHFESRLRSDIHLAGIPFPPVVFARSSAALIAQAYISSNPASGLLLISPPWSNTSLSKDLLPTALKEFDFEPKFPIGIMGTPKEVEVLQQKSRLGQDPGVDMIQVDDIDSQEAFVRMELWLDDWGIWLQLLYNIYLWAPYTDN